MPVKLLLCSQLQVGLRKTTSPKVTLLEIA